MTERKIDMSAAKKYLIMALIIIAGIVCGRLAVRAFLDFLLGGTLFGGDFL